MLSLLLFTKTRETKQIGDTKEASHLFSVVCKTFARILFNRPIPISERNLPEAQCGFQPGRSTVNMIFTLKQVREKCIEQNKVLYSGFIDMLKASDSVNRVALWTVLERHGWPKKFVGLIQLPHAGMTGQLFCSRDTAAAFSITNGVKQGFVLAPALFNLSHAVRVIEEGIFLRRLNAKTKYLHQLIQEALFADDCALLAHKLASCSSC